MQNTMNNIQRSQLGPQLQQIRIRENLSLKHIVSSCKLREFELEMIEKGLGISIKKYLRLIQFYNKKIKIILK